MKVLTKSDIIEIGKILSENLDILAGKDDNSRILIKPGLKIRNKKTDLTYTVRKVRKDENDKLSFVCTRPGFKIIITSDDLTKNYERQ
jgi:hypothetical protein